MSVFSRDRESLKVIWSLPLKLLLKWTMSSTDEGLGLISDAVAVPEDKAATATDVICYEVEISR